MSAVCLSWLSMIFRAHVKQLKGNAEIEDLMQEVRMRLRHRTSMMGKLRGLKANVDLALSTCEDSGTIINVDACQIFKEEVAVEHQALDSEGESTSHQSPSDLEY